MSQLRINPFFDGESASRGRAPEETAGPAVEGEAYLDASRVNDRRGMPLSSLVSQGVPGLRNIVIPHASEEGVPIGNNPHNRNRILQIDPHLRGENSQINLNDLSPARVAAATRAASDMLDVPARDVVTRRLHGAAAMHLAAQGPRGQTHQEPARRQSRGPAPRPAAAMPTMPRSSFFDDPEPALPPGQRLRPLDLRTTEAEPVTEPGIAVVFENRDRSRQQAWYHDVKFENGFVLLVFDTRYRGPRYMLPRIQQAGGDVVLGPLTAMTVAGMSNGFGVRATPFVFTDGVKEYAVLLLVAQVDAAEHAAPQEEASHDETGDDQPGTHAE